MTAVGGVPAVFVRSLAVCGVPRCAVFDRELEHDHEIVSSIDFSRRVVIL